MKLIIGLGNPGKEYEQTWHNAGFLAIDLLKTKQADEFLSCKISKKFKAEVCENNSPEEKIILAKPQTFMNKSGESAKALGNFYKIKPADLWVIHDDIDLPLGKIRISHNASAAGHKGVQSIMDQLNSQEFVRFRIGISSPNQGQIPTEDYVLQKIAKEDKVIIEQSVAEVIAAVELALAQGISEAMNEFN